MQSFVSNSNQPTTSSHQQQSHQLHPSHVNHQIRGPSNELPGQRKAGPNVLESQQAALETHHRQQQQQQVQQIPRPQFKVEPPQEFQRTPMLPHFTHGHR